MASLPVPEMASLPVPEMASLPVPEMGSLPVPVSKTLHFRFHTTSFLLPKLDCVS